MRRKRRAPAPAYAERRLCLDEKRRANACCLTVAAFVPQGQRASRPSFRGFRGRALGIARPSVAQKSRFFSRVPARLPAECVLARLAERTYSEGTCPNIPSREEPWESTCAWRPNREKSRTKFSTIA